MPDRLRLAMPVDLAGLQADVRRLAGAEWVAHFNTRQYEGDWSGVALRSPGGQSGRLYPDLTEKLSWQDTAELAQCPAVVALVALLGCPVTSLRFLQLAPLAVITAHRDHQLRLEDGEVRLHVPVFTNPHVEFVLEGERVVMAEGECWYLDLTGSHSVHNRGTSPRVHLVVDCVVDDQLLRFFP